LSENIIIYVEPAIVINPITVTNDKISGLICPKLTPIEIKIKENSEICATVKTAIKPVFLLYPKIPLKFITIIGLPIRMNSESTIAGQINPEMSVKNHLTS
jgi:hypothetical protein